MLVSAPRRAQSLQLMVWWARMLESAERIANLQDTSPVPRGELAERLRQYARVFDRERTWDAVAEGGELRSRTYAMVAVLEEQGRRAAR